MNIRFRLVALNFLQYFVLGTWIISFGGYLMATLKFSGGQVGGIYSTMGLASILTPGLVGIVADRWINPERMNALCHFAGACLLLFASSIGSAAAMYWVTLFIFMFYMPTIALTNSISYELLSARGFDVVKDFPPIRVWGTIGFIAAMWTVDLLGWTVSLRQLYVASGAALALGLYSLTLPRCLRDPSRKSVSLASVFGLDAWELLKNRQMAVFFFFSILIGAALQITNTFGEAFLHDFGSSYTGSFVSAHPGLLMSISQISETLFILTIPFFLGKLGIKTVMMMSIWAWVLRFGLFAIGNPGRGLVFLVLSMVVYGMAFDFYNISGSLFVEIEAAPPIRASAQGLFLMMTNGLGALVGGVASGAVVDHFTRNGVRDWPSIWAAFSGYMLALGIVFPWAFRPGRAARKARQA